MPRLDPQRVPSARRSSAGPPASRLGIFPPTRSHTGLPRTGIRPAGPGKRETRNRIHNCSFFHSGSMEFEFSPPAASHPCASRRRRYGGRIEAWHAAQWEPRGRGLPRIRPGLGFAEARRRPLAPIRGRARPRSHRPEAHAPSGLLPQRARRVSGEMQSRRLGLVRECHQSRSALPMQARDSPKPARRRTPGRGSA